MEMTNHGSPVVLMEMTSHGSPVVLMEMTSHGSPVVFMEMTSHGSPVVFSEVLCMDACGARVRMCVLWQLPSDSLEPLVLE